MRLGCLAVRTSTMETNIDIGTHIESRVCVRRRCHGRGPLALHSAIALADAATPHATV